MEFNPDNIIYFQWGFVKINATLVFSWIVILILWISSWLITRKVTSGAGISRWQNLLESVVSIIQDQIREASQQNPQRYLPFIGTLFLFIVFSNMLTIIPGFNAPTASLSTTAALAACVFVAVPVFGIVSLGIKGYLLQYVRPTPFMLPFNIIGELSRTLALAIRLFGNIMSGSLVVAILLSLAPLFFPVIMQILGLLVGFIQAYVFAILALVYIASATRAHHEKNDNDKDEVLNQSQM
ncbi:MAG TPA: F0F1 ATP synthase subunit A [Balneolales bacterium]|nr:F0F1 ATP synthase subunit A [Balneolales bacterium]